MLAYVAGSVSTDLNVWERMACPCVSQAVCHSATTASVVWPLALDFIFTRCVSPCPWNFNIGWCANEKPLRLIAHRRVRFFTFMFVSTLVLGAGGELVESNSSFGKYCDPGDSWVYLLSVNMVQKKRCMIFDSGMMTDEESYVLRWLNNGTLC